MKLALWAVFLLVSLVWTGLFGLAEKLMEWLLAAMAAGQIGDMASQARQWPTPAWLSPWVDAAAIKALQDAALGGAEWLTQVLPPTSSLMDWVSALIWVLWGLGMAIWLGLALAGHWWLSRRTNPGMPHAPT